MIFTVASDDGGCCDCGDPEAWNRPLGCHFHEPPDAAAAASDTLAEDAMDTDSDSPPSSARGLSGQLNMLPPAILSVFQEHISLCLDMILDTLEHAPDRVGIPVTTDAVERLERYPSLDPYDPVPSLSLTRPVPERPAALSVATSGRRNDFEGLNTANARTARDYHDAPEESFASSPGETATEDDPMDESEDGAPDPSSDQGRLVQPPIDVSDGIQVSRSSRSNITNDTQTGPDSAVPNTGSHPFWNSSALGRPRTVRRGRAVEEARPRYDYRHYTLLVWNDEFHDYPSVMSVMMDVTGMDANEAKAITDEMDQQGRVTVSISSDVRDMLMGALQISGVNLAVSIQPSYDIFAENVANHLWAHLSDLASSFLFLGKGCSSFLSYNAFRFFITDQLEQQWQHMYPISHDRMSSAFFDPSDLRRVDGLLILESKLPKRARMDFKSLLLKCLRTKETRMELGMSELHTLLPCTHKTTYAALRFTAMYASMIETFILREREEDHSITSLGVQFFPIPSVATTLVQSCGFLERLLDILRALTTLNSRMHGHGLYLPPPPSDEADPNNPLFREQRCYSLYYVLRNLLATQGVHQLLVADPTHLCALLSFFSLFTGISPDVRRTGEHLEFESELWVPVFHVSSHLGRTAKLIGEAFDMASPEQLVRSLRYVLDSILHDWDAIPRRAKTLYPMHAWHEVELGGTAFKIVKYDVASQAVSFHHPIHWVLAELLHHERLLSSENLRPLILDGTHAAPLMPSQLAEQEQHMLSVLMGQGQHRLFTQLGPDLAFKVVLDYPLRVVVKVAQEHVGMWVRNGFALRSQATHYRGSQMRSIMFNQDLYLLQCGFLLLDQSWLVTILDRFGVLDFIRTAPVPSTESPQSISDEHKLGLLDECLLLLVHLLTEASLCGGWSIPQQVRHEIVHFLAFGPSTFSDVSQGISTRSADHPSFQHVLAEVAHYVPPTGIIKQGTYELRPNCFKEVHPYFVHYSRNQREKAEELLMECYKKEHTGPNGQLAPGSNPVEIWAARPPRIEPGTLFSDPRFLSVLLTSQFQALLAGVIHVVRSVSGHESLEVKVPDTLVDSLLQLISAGLTCRGPAFVKRLLEPLGSASLAAPPGQECTPLIVLMCWLEGDERFKAHRSKLSWLLDQVAQCSKAAEGDAGLQRVNALFSVGGKTVAAASKEASEAKRLEARRAAARARQSAIMKKFTQQQQDLLKSFDGDEDEESGPHDSGVAPDTSEARMKSDAEPGARTARLTDEEVASKYGSCILCQDGLKPGSPFGMLVHVQQSRTMRILPCADLEALGQSVDVPLILDRGDRSVVTEGKAVAGEIQDTTRSKDVPRLRGKPARYTSWPSQDARRPAGSFPPAFNRPGLYTTTCGHMMHSLCFDTYCQTIEARHHQQISRQAPENLFRMEVVCPLCKALGNALLPLPDSHQCEVLDDEVDYQPDTRTLPDWIRKVNIDILKWNKPIDLQESHTGSGTFKPWYADENPGSLPTDRQTGQPLWKPATETMLLRFFNATKQQAGDMKGLMTKMQQRTILALPSRRIYMPQDLMGYTLSMIEVSQRGRAAPDSVVDNINESTMYLLRGMLHALRLRAMLTNQGEHAHEMIRQGLLKRLLPHWLTDESVRSPLILRDPISILVEAAVTMPQELDHIITLMYYVNLVQLVFGLAQPCMWPPGAAGYPKYKRLFARRSAAATPIMPSQPQGPPDASPTGMNKADVAAAREIFPDVRWMVANIIGLVGYARGNISLGVDHLEDDTLAKLLCTHTLPFLRRAAILRAAVLGSNPPAARQSQADAVPATAGASEYMRLMQRLAIPLPSSALPARNERQTSLVGIIDSWIKQAYVPLVSLFQPLPIQYSLTTPASGAGAGGPHHLPGAPMHPILLLEHAGLYELVDLPDDLATLVEQTNQRKCHRCGKTPADPALCLLCGEVVCYQSFCCQSEDGKRGECNLHTDECGGDMGLFLKIKTNVILALCKGLGTFVFSPYLDAHGEVDIGLRKGRIQRLHRQRYDDIRKQWLSHNIPNTVTRKIEATHDSGGWSTF